MQKLDDKRVVLFFSNEVEEGSYKLNSYIKILDLESMELGDAHSGPDFIFGPYDSNGVFVDCAEKSGRCIFGVSIRVSSGNEGGMDRYNLAFYGFSGTEVHDLGSLKSGQIEACGGFC